jgi:hypothetical protein
VPETGGTAAACAALKGQEQVNAALGSAPGHERRFRPVRQMSAYLLTAAEKQTSANRCLGPKATF